MIITLCGKKHGISYISVLRLSIHTWIVIFEVTYIFHTQHKRKAHLELEILHHSHFFALQNEQLLLMQKQYRLITGEKFSPLSTRTLSVFVYWSPPTTLYLNYRVQHFAMHAKLSFRKWLKPTFPSSQMVKNTQRAKVNQHITITELINSYP